MDASNPTARDLATLQDIWEQVAIEENGMADAPDSSGALGAWTTIQGNHFAVHARSGERLLEGRFLLDAATAPRSITWIDAIGPDAGKHLPASYRLDGDRFVFIAADEGMPRPVEFRSAPGQAMRTFVRRHARGEAPAPPMADPAPAPPPVSRRTGAWRG
jgi:uncharacterized protein (TIGR03067 family)